MINTSQDLKDLLFRINRKSYPAYKDTKGSYRFPGYVLSIDHVQGDPFAAPSKISLHIKGAQAGFPESLYATREMRIALQNQLIRGFAAHIEKYNFRAKGSGKSGLIAISKPGQEILERSACTMDAKNGDLTIRLEVGFPANGRTINSGELIKILFDFLPVCVKDALFYRNLDALKLCLCYDEGENLRRVLREGEKENLRTIMEQTIFRKPAAHCFEHPAEMTETHEMVKIGG